MPGRAERSATLRRMSTKCWLCTVCKQPISAGKGYVLIMDPRTNGHPLPASQRQQREEEDVAQRRRDAEAAKIAGDVERAKEIEAVVAAWDRVKAPPVPGQLMPLDVSDHLMVRLIEYPPVTFKAVHADCDADPDGKSAYWFGVERAATLDQWVAWAHHLAPKTWMTKKDISLMLAFWYANRDLGIPST
jgi:hypothetical protein